jgi:hypothetical protein
MRNIKQGKVKKKNHAPVELPQVPADFASFRFYNNLIFSPIYYRTAVYFTVV